MKEEVKSFSFKSACPVESEPYSIEEIMTRKEIPKTVEEAIDYLIAELPLKDKTRIAKMDKREIIALHRTMGPHIRDEFGLLKGNSELLESCRILSGHKRLHMDAVPGMLIDLLWARLRRTHSLRVIK